MKNQNLGRKVIMACIATALVVGISVCVAMIIHNRNGVQEAIMVKDGLSAYELAVQYGYEGTVEEWLDSLEGKSAYEIAIENGYTGTEDNWISSLKASNGKDGVGIKTAAFSYGDELLLTLTDGTVLNLGVTDGCNGKDGANGKDGVGITAANINADGQLVISFSDGKSVNLDKVVGMNGEDGIGVSSSEINASGELVITYTNGQAANLGVVVGAKGEKGDKGDKGDQGETGNAGKDGVSVTKTEINNKGELVITLSDNTVLNLGVVVGAKGDKGDKGEAGAQGIQGEQGISVVGAEINSKGELVLIFSNNQRTNVGNVIGAKGDKGEQGAQGEKGDKGDIGAQGVAGKDGQDGISVTKTEINNKGELVITLSDNTVSNLGVVIGAKGEEGDKGEKGETGAAGKDGEDGEDGTGIETIIIENGNLKITLTTGTTLDLGNIQGEKGDKGDVGAQGIQGVQGEKGDKGETGATGLGVKSTTINTVGELVIIYSDDTEVNLGRVIGADGAKGEQGIQGIQGVQGEKGDKGEKGEKGDTGVAGVGVAKVELENDELVITLSDDTVINLGNVKGSQGEKGDKGDKGETGVGITNVTITSEGHLKITFTTGNTEDLGNIKGADGRGVDEIKIENNILKIKYSDSDTFIELGNVKGDKGNQGDKGDTGAQGPKGDKGDPGRGIVRTEISGTNLIVYYTDNTTETHDLSGIAGDPNERAILVYSLLPDGTYGVMAGGMAKYEATIEIPATYNGVAVTQILDDGFSGLSRLQKIILHENITTIGTGAFWSCTSLTSISFPESLRKIEAYAFQHARLTSAIFHSPDNWKVRTTTFSGPSASFNKAYPTTVGLKNNGSYLYNGLRYNYPFICDISDPEVAAIALTKEWSDTFKFTHTYSSGGTTTETSLVSATYYSSDWTFEE